MGYGKQKLLVTPFQTEKKGKNIFSFVWGLLTSLERISIGISALFFRVCFVFPDNSVFLMYLGHTLHGRETEIWVLTDTLLIDVLTLCSVRWDFVFHLGWGVLVSFFFFFCIFHIRPLHCEKYLHIFGSWMYTSTLTGPFSVSLERGLQGLYFAAWNNLFCLWFSIFQENL